MKKLIVPSHFCIHDRDKLLKLMEENEINTDSDWFVYRDFDSGAYIICQDNTTIDRE
jgi:hypothetical protein